METDVSKGILNPADIYILARKALKGHWLKLSVMMVFIGMTGNLLNLKILTLKRVGRFLWVKHPAGAEWSLLRGLPGGLIAFLLFSLIWLLIAPMIRFGVTAICKKRLLLEDWDIGMLFQWRMLIKTLAAEIICGFPAWAAIAVDKFSGFSEGEFGHVIYLALLGATVYLFYMWNMRFYIWTEKPDMGIMDVLRESRRRMKGRQRYLLLLHLSYFREIALIVFCGYGLPEFIRMFIELDTGSFTMSFAVIFIGFGAALVRLRMGETLFYMNLYASGNAGTLNEKLVIAENSAPAANPAVLKTYTQMQGDNEEKAFAMFSEYGYSLRKLEENGLLDAFESMNISPGIVDGWRAMRGEALLEKYPDNPECLKAILDFAEEYANRYIIAEIIRRMEEAMAANTIQDETILDHCLKTAEILNIGFVAESPDFVHSQKQTLSRTLDSLEVRLTESDPGGSWKYTMALARSALK